MIFFGYRLERLEDENLKLRCDLSLNSPRFRECRELLQRVLREMPAEQQSDVADWLTRYPTKLSSVPQVSHLKHTLAVALGPAARV